MVTNLKEKSIKTNKKIEININQYIQLIKTIKLKR
ncbi:MAG: hypothetical protein RL311_1317 [Bacteroidota bacterium]|jgi:hypothetical protein